MKSPNIKQKCNSAFESMPSGVTSFRFICEIALLCTMEPSVTPAGSLMLVPVPARLDRQGSTARPIQLALRESTPTEVFRSRSLSLFLSPMNLHGLCVASLASIPRVPMVILSFRRYRKMERKDNGHSETRNACIVHIRQSCRAAECQHCHPSLHLGQNLEDQPRNIIWLNGITCLVLLEATRRGERVP